MQQLELLDEWESDEVVTPPRSRLNSLQIEGVGTPNQEALMSYFVALAHSHCVKPYTMMIREVIPRTQVRIQKYSSMWHNRAIRTIHYHSLYAEELAHALGQLTLREDLAYGTFLPWRDLLDPRGGGLLAARPKWCPSCLGEWRSASRQVRFPLYWYTVAARCCIQHGDMLRDACPHCLRNQPFLPSHSHLDHCSYCGGWLGSEPMDCLPPLTGATEYDLFAARAVAEMIAENPVAHAYATYPRLIERLKAYATLLVGGSMTRLGKLVGVQGTVFLQWANKARRPQLPNLMRLCYGLGLTPVQFLRDDIPHEIPDIQPKPMMSKPRRQPVLTEEERAAILQHFEMLMDQVEVLPTRLQLAADLGRSISFLKYWFETEVLALAARRAEQVSARARKRLEVKEETAYRITLELLTSQSRVTRKNIDARLAAHRLSMKVPQARAGVARAKKEYFHGGVKSLNGFE